MWQHYVYIHRCGDTDEPFYVGKGSHRKCQKRQIYFERAYARDSRNVWWLRVASKHGFSVEIVASCRSDKVAQELEKELVNKIGRRDLGLGPLVNVTDGGDGHAGIIVSEALREKRRQNSKGPRSDKWKAAIRASRKNGGNGGVVKLGDKLPERWRQSIAATKFGSRNPMFGMTGERHPNSRIVLNNESGVFYHSISEAAEVHGVKMKSLYNMLTGFRPNSTQLRFA